MLKNPQMVESEKRHVRQRADPLGHLLLAGALSTAASGSVPVTLATDSKASSNADSQWWSRPKFVPDPQQAESYVTLTEDGTVPEP